jgi:hypothetical protein
MEFGAVELHRLVGRIEFVCVGQQRCRDLVVAARPRFPRGAAQRFGGGRQQAVDEGAHLRFGQGAGELIDQFAGDEGLDVGDAAHAAAGGDFRVLVGVQLGQHEAPAILGGELFQHRLERSAGSAPLGPEIDQHRGTVRGIDDFFLEVGGADVERKGFMARRVVSQCRSGRSVSGLAPQGNSGGTGAPEGRRRRGIIPRLALPRTFLTRPGPSIMAEFLALRGSAAFSASRLARLQQVRRRNRFRHRAGGRTLVFRRAGRAAECRGNARLKDLLGIPATLPASPPKANCCW